jgi:hypothetical protein
MIQRTNYSSSMNCLIGAIPMNYAARKFYLL